MLGRFLGTVAMGVAVLRGRGAGAIVRFTFELGFATGTATRRGFLRRGGGSVVTVDGRHFGATAVAIPRVERLALRSATGAARFGGAAGGIAASASSGEGRTMSCIGVGVGCSGFGTALALDDGGGGGGVAAARGAGGGVACPVCGLTNGRETGGGTAGSGAGGGAENAAAASRTSSASSCCPAERYVRARFSSRRAAISARPSAASSSATSMWRSRRAGAIASAFVMSANAGRIDPASAYRWDPAESSSTASSTRPQPVAQSAKPRWARNSSGSMLRTARYTPSASASRPALRCAPARAKGFSVRPTTTDKTPHLPPLPHRGSGEPTRMDM